MKGTTTAIVEEFLGSNLGPGDEHSEDSNDKDGFICFALVCRTFPLSTCKTAAQFTALLCLRALQHLCPPGIIENTENWDELVRAALKEIEVDNKNKIDCDLVAKAQGSLHWLVLCSSLVAVKTIVDWGGSKMRGDAPRCLATVNIALDTCLLAGMELFKYLEESGGEDDAENVSTPKLNEYKSVEEARDVSQLLNLLKTQCTQLDSASRQFVTSQPHFQRISRTAQLIKKYVTANLGKGAQKNPVQNSLSGWVKSGSTAINNEDSDTEDSDDEPESPAKKQRLEAKENQARAALAASEDDLENPAKKQRLEAKENQAPAAVVAVDAQC
jgi:hypothetical protein